jgi:aspartate aminotransferase
VPLLGSAGLKIAEYPYYDGAAHSVDFRAMLKSLEGASRGDLVLLHGCCHNPTGADLERAQWDAVTDVVVEKGLLPFVDLAYQGLGEGLDEDAYGPRALARTLPELMLAYSCSKNFGLYRDRIGTLLIVSPAPEQAEAALTHVNNIARGIYSMPPAHGGALVKTVLNDPVLRAQWQEEVDSMRQRIHTLRALLADTLEKLGAPRDFAFIKREHGMFSFLGITKEQVQRLRKEYSIYMVDSSRINVAGVSPTNVEYLAKAIISVL